jgi:hypothetical protein
MDNQRLALEYISSIEVNQVLMEVGRANVDREERDLEKGPTQLQEEMLLVHPSRKGSHLCCSSIEDMLTEWQNALSILKNECSQ